MLIQIADFNGSKDLIENEANNEWGNIEEVLSMMPLHLKASDQAGIQGSAIFDPVGTNGYIKDGLVERGWLANIPIPKEYSFIGTDVDFGKNKIIVEVQFSNYPFLLNNILRSELFYKGKIKLTGKEIAGVIVITKCHMFPSSNSTLYYEQGYNQIDALSKHNVFDVPIRLVGIKENYGSDIDSIWTEYDSARYSRTVSSRLSKKCNISAGRSANSRSVITVSA